VSFIYLHNKQTPPRPTIMCNCWPLCFKIERDYSDNYVCFKCSKGDLKKYQGRYEHGISWFIILPIFFVIGLPCLLVGMSQYNDVAMNNAIMTFLYNSESVLQHNDSVILFADKTNCRKQQSLVPPYPHCADIDMQTTDKYCTMRGKCDQESCAAQPCYFQCDSNICQTREQQQHCYNAMTSGNINCQSYFDSNHTSYACIINPAAVLPICQKECGDMQCHSTPGKCMCKCTHYQTNICDIIKIAEFTDKIFFDIREGIWPYTGDSPIFKQCNITDAKCMFELNELINITYPATPIYYNSMNPYINTKYIDIKPITKSTIGLLIFGLFFSGIGILLLLLELLILCKSRYTCKCARIIFDEESQPLSCQNVENYQGSNCRVCERPFTEKTAKLILACKHEFHNECLAKNKMNQQYNCPICSRVYPILQA
jgi:hypothetical protein